MMFVLGLTGSIGMGKSTAARFFSEAGVPVHDADAAVHRLYQGEAAALIEAAFPGTTADGEVDRVKLAARVLDDPAAIRRLEAVIHPLVRESEKKFLAEAAERGDRIVVLDIPLLLETGAEQRLDAVVVVSANPQVQRARVLGRPGMNEAKLDAILAKQLPDSEKRRRAHFVVDTSGSLDSTRAQVHGILRAVAGLPGRFA
jgi:dephospho-CoA kinase